MTIKAPITWRDGGRKKGNERTKGVERSSCHIYLHMREPYGQCGRRRKGNTDGAVKKVRSPNEKVQRGGKYSTHEPRRAAAPSVACRFSAMGREKLHRVLQDDSNAANNLPFIQSDKLTITKCVQRVFGVPFINTKWFAMHGHVSFLLFFNPSNWSMRWTV